jgi:hypothetical protein
MLNDADADDDVEEEEEEADEDDCCCCCCPPLSPSAMASTRNTGTDGGGHRPLFDAQQFPRILSWIGEVVVAVVGVLLSVGQRPMLKAVANAAFHWIGHPLGKIIYRYNLILLLGQFNM